MTAHAKFSPSGAHRWMSCAGSLALESGFEDKGSDFAQEGTDAHALAAYVLESGKKRSTGETFTYDDHGTTRSIKLSSEMVDYVQDYVDLVHGYADGGELMVEQRVEFSIFLGIPDQFGTSDAVILSGDTITIIDLKYGKGVRVDAEFNEQLQLYALGCLHEFGYLGDFKNVVMVVHQPRLHHVSEWRCTVDELLAFGEKARDAAQRALQVIENPSNDTVIESLTVGESQCRFCKAKGACPALAKQVVALVTDDFVDLTQPLRPALEAASERTFDNKVLSNLLGAADLIEGFVKAVRARAESALLKGEDVPGYKLVAGKQGARAWSNEEEAEKLLKSFRLKQDEMYDKKIISPTTAEKVLEESPSRWEKLQEVISRKNGARVLPAERQAPRPGGYADRRNVRRLGRGRSCVSKSPTYSRPISETRLYWRPW